MSYARFSTDDHRSDVYVYESANGFIIHTAGCRTGLTEEELSQLPPAPKSLDTPEDMEAFVLRSRRVTELLLNMDREVEFIDSPIAGETFTCDSPGETAERLEELREEGFYVPQRAFDALREEQLVLDEIQRAN